MTVEEEGVQSAFSGEIKEYCQRLLQDNVPL